jgi:hypothetical protein
MPDKKKWMIGKANGDTVEVEGTRFQRQNEGVDVVVYDGDDEVVIVKNFQSIEPV